MGSRPAASHALATLVIVMVTVSQGIRAICTRMGRTVRLLSTLPTTDHTLLTCPRQQAHVSTAAVEIFRAFAVSISMGAVILAASG